MKIHINTVKKCRNSVNSIYKQLNQLLSISDLCETQDKKALQENIDNLSSELTALMNTCDTIRKTLKNLT